MARRDPYLSIAEATQFLDHLPQYTAAAALDFVLELTPAGAATLRGLASKPPIAVNLAHLDAHSRFVTARMPLAALESLADAGALADCELAEPLRHQQTQRPFGAPDEGISEAAPLQVRPPPPQPSGTLVAMIDDGCPFAHAEFRRLDAPGTRVVALWDMDPYPELAFEKASAPAGFFRGREVPGRQMEDWMERFSAGGGPDEAACYEAAGYSPLAFQVTHGSHLLGRVAGATYARGTVPDPAAKADIAFVQLPRREAESPGSGSIHACILDGLRYLRGLAERNGYERCVVTCGWGSMLGPHDGTSLFERALDAFLLETSSVRFDIVLPAGNGFEDSIHARLEPEYGQDARVAWVLPANNEVPSFAELWIDEPSADVAISIEIHGQRVLVPDDGSPVWPTPWLVAVRNGERITLRAAPTSVSDGITPQAEPGPVPLVASAAKSARVHGYVCWGGSNLACTLASRQAEWHVFAGEGGCVVDGRGTLLGDACGKCLERIHVVGGYVGGGDPAQFVRAPYSAAGPSRGPRTGPAFLALSDEDFARRGLRGPGTRSGMEVRIWGTSVAIPQAARALVNGENLQDAIAPAPGAGPEEEGGRGCLR